MVMVTTVRLWLIWFHPLILSLSFICLFVSLVFWLADVTGSLAPEIIVATREPSIKVIQLLSGNTDPSVAALAATASTAKMAFTNSFTVRVCLSICSFVLFSFVYSLFHFFLFREKFPY
jgi:hypothetical protein